MSQLVRLLVRNRGRCPAARSETSSRMTSGRNCDDTVARRRPRVPETSLELRSARRLRSAQTRQDTKRNDGSMKPLRARAGVFSFGKVAGRVRETPQSANDELLCWRMGQRNGRQDATEC